MPVRFGEGGARVREPRKADWRLRSGHPTTAGLRNVADTPLADRLPSSRIDGSLALGQVFSPTAGEYTPGRTDAGLQFYERGGMLT